MRKLLPRRSVRLRLTVLYTVLFLLSGVVLLAIASGVVVASSAVTAHAPPQPNPQSALARAQARIHQLQAELNAHTLPGVSHQLLVGSAVALSVMTLASAALGWIVAGRVLRPLRAITAATRRIPADSLHERLAMTGPRDELTDFADTIDGLLDGLLALARAARRAARPRRALAGRPRRRLNHRGRCVRIQEDHLAKSATAASSPVASVNAPRSGSDGVSEVRTGTAGRWARASAPTAPAGTASPGRRGCP
jgi:HAMP domain-containing protein